ncbi:DUF72 domain-containing protein [Pseudobacteriovorax antillogorgiicola]|uniref:Uncharacterized conserved protein YecE, DUF72 family n=1 Tax=Pseudobacteriovorax antillogorgiicola TaxID=1513793 RepID=A0A1Y6C8X2_9BACT|nr:DUF72 domain-containing protein [Pseudobacteriovorax antillogorgiicola]TCS49081.1 uncharacterized protein YecE (DUF72 family) [Pseudobacteriovorax antillogorgiicola]SMF52015.1 Uncharacterized conserved protein YecE, DUF72 family [Pseudobacteriovorax antillogorgiicola]
MHFGRVESLRDIDWSIPQDQPRTKGFLGLDWQGQQELVIGAPIWGCPEWVPKIYPSGTRSRDYLYHYSRKYEAIEFNPSFYSLPSIDQIKHWRRQVPDQFRFCPKVPQDISARLGAYDAKLLHEYLHCLEAFGKNLGLPFMQLPESLALKEFAYLQKFLQIFPKDVSLAIEFRHPSWFYGGMLRDDVINYLYRYGKSAVITDTPGRRDAVHVSLTYPQVMIRFLGYFHSGTDEPRLRAWIKRIFSWLEKGLDRAYLFIHQPNHSLIPDALDYLQWKIFEQQHMKKNKQNVL